MPESATQAITVGEFLTDESSRNWTKFIDDLPYKYLLEPLQAFLLKTAPLPDVIPLAGKVLHIAGVFGLKVPHL